MSLWPGGSDEASSCCGADTCRSDTGNTGLPAEETERGTLNTEVWLQRWSCGDEDLCSGLTWTSRSSLGRWNCHSLQKLESCSRKPTVWSASSKHARLCTVRTAFRHWAAEDRKNMKTSETTVNKRQNSIQATCILLWTQVCEFYLLKCI